MGKFAIRKTNTGIKFDLKASSGEVIATSEVYSSLPPARKASPVFRKTPPLPLWKIRLSKALLWKSIRSLKSMQARPASSGSV